MEMRSSITTDYMHYGPRKMGEFQGGHCHPMLELVFRNSSCFLYHFCDLASMTQTDRRHLVQLVIITLTDV